VLKSLPPARISRRFSDVYRFFSAGQFDADYALTVWVEPTEGEEVQYRWQLIRLMDGRTKEGTGIGLSPHAARWAAALSGVERLQEAIVKGNRQVSDFKLEVRLPGTNGDGQRLIEAAQPDLRARLQDFGTVRVISLASAGNT
jgi:hypothetical protein